MAGVLLPESRSKSWCNLYPSIRWKSRPKPHILVSACSEENTVLKASSFDHCLRTGTFVVISKQNGELCPPSNVLIGTSMLNNHVWHRQLFMVVIELLLVIGLHQEAAVSTISATTESQTWTLRNTSVAKASPTFYSYRFLLQWKIFNCKWSPDLEGPDSDDKHIIENYPAVFNSSSGYNEKNEICDRKTSMWVDKGRDRRGQKGEDGHHNFRRSTAGRSQEDTNAATSRKQAALDSPWWRKILNITLP